jgi:hypothetical protein
MQTICKLALVVSYVLPTLVFMSGVRNPAYGHTIAPRDDYCMVFYRHGKYCGFTSYTQCTTSASGIGGECFASPGSANLYRQDEGGSSVSAKSYRGGHSN